MTDRPTPTGPPPGPTSGPSRRPAPQPFRRGPLLTHSLVALGGIGVGLLLGLLLGEDDSGGGPAATVTVTTSPPQTGAATERGTAPAAERPTTARTPTAAAGRNTIPGDGTFLVGEDIAPGTYRSEGGSDGPAPFCFWSRLRGTTGDPGEVIAADGSKGPVTVTVLASDKAFKTAGCKPWHRAN
ncbi:hypothetical protein [Streptomyces sp. NPDC051909]|uniref:hypothetical protein n=1 Tax=Streptomyces sp. NPDC051909 TaxID=3154944 RepID=UPI00342ACF6E